MNPFEQFKCLSLSLNPKNRSLTATLLFEEDRPYMSLAMIVELENLVKWLTTKIEINAVLFNSNIDSFGHGLNLYDWEQKGEQKLFQIYKRFQRLVYGMFFLPQTIVVDYGNMARGVGAEFGLCADIRFCRNGAKIEFSKLAEGLVPMSGGVGFLSSLVGKSRAKSWLLSPFAPSNSALLESGYITETYPEGESPAQKYVSAIATQSPIARIQTKTSQLQAILPELDKALEFEESYASGCMAFGDWREFMDAKRDDRKPAFKGPREASRDIKSAINEV